MANIKIKRYKHENQTSYTLGMTLTIELLLQKPELIEIVFVSSNLEENENTVHLRKLCKQHSIAFECNDKAFNIFSSKGNCYVIGVFRKFKTTLSETSHIVLVNPSDSGNMGNIVRTAVGFGINNIAIIKPAVDIYDPKAIRATMGALFHINFEYFDSIYEYREMYLKHNLFAFMLNAKNTLHFVNFIEPFSLIFGNEAMGLPTEYANFCNTVVIPHSKNIDSLNLTSAVSIAMYVATSNKWK